MDKRNWLRRRPNASRRQISRVEPAVCETLVAPDLPIGCSIGGVSIVLEFLNIWDDLSKHYGDCKKDAADAGQVKTVPVDRNLSGGKSKSERRKTVKKWSAARVDRPYERRPCAGTEAVCDQQVTDTVQSVTDMIEENTATATTSSHDQSKGPLRSSSVVEEEQLYITATEEMKTHFVPAATGCVPDHSQSSYSVSVTGDQAGHGSGLSAVAATDEEKVLDQPDTALTGDRLASTDFMQSPECGMLGNHLESRIVGTETEGVPAVEDCKDEFADTEGKLKGSITKMKLPRSRPRKKKKMKHRPVQASTVPLPASNRNTEQSSEITVYVTKTVDDNWVGSLNRLLQQSGDQTEGAGQPGVRRDGHADACRDGPIVYTSISQATVCDLNNNPIVTPSYSLRLSTIIDAGEDLSSEDVAEGYTSVVPECDSCDTVVDVLESEIPAEDDPDDDTPVEDISGSPAATLAAKHPLEHDWTFWYFYPDRKRTWEENLRTIKTVSTIEDFWAVHNWIEPPSRLQTGADYSLFKVGISPDWEDVANKKGGRWLVNCGRQGVDGDWKEVIMAMVGQQFGEGQDTQVNGAVVSLRNRGDRVAVWVREVAGSDKVGDMMSMVLGRSGAFKVHKKQMW